MPTDRAFRLFIDALMHVRALTSEEAASIRETFFVARTGAERDARDGQASLRTSQRDGGGGPCAARGVARFSGGSVSCAPGPTKSARAVLLMKNGTVQNRFLRGFRDRPGSRTHPQSFSTTSSKDGRSAICADLFERRLQGERMQYDELRRHAPSNSEAPPSAKRRGARPTSSSKGKTACSRSPNSPMQTMLRRLVLALDAREKLVQAARLGGASQGRPRRRRRRDRRSRGWADRDRRRVVHVARAIGGAGRCHRAHSMDYARVLPLPLPRRHRR